MSASDARVSVPVASVVRDTAEPDVVSREPWWIRHVEVAAILVVAVVALLTTHNAIVLWPLAAMVAAVLRWNGPWPSITVGDNGREDARP